MSNVITNAVSVIVNAITAPASDEMKLPSYVCISDIKRRDNENKVNYSASQLAKADAILALVDDVFIRSRVFMNYRQKFIAVKVNNPSMRDKVQLKAVKLENWAKANNVKIEHTRYGNTVYRITAEQLDAITTVAL